MNLTREQKISYIAQAYGNARCYVEATANYLNENELTVWSEKAAKHSAQQVLAMIVND